jgi:hypothetical protein
MRAASRSSPACPCWWAPGRTFAVGRAHHRPYGDPWRNARSSPSSKATPTTQPACAIGSCGVFNSSRRRLTPPGTKTSYFGPHFRPTLPEGLVPDDRGPSFDEGDLSTPAPTCDTGRGGGFELASMPKIRGAALAVCLVGLLLAGCNRPRASLRGLDDRRTSHVHND